MIKEEFELEVVDPKAPAKPSNPTGNKDVEMQEL